MLPISVKFRRTCIIIGLTIIFTAIAGLFWHNEFVYKLPTPVPKNYQVVKQGNNLVFLQRIGLKSKKPIFLHFFNPDCPCSKFNMVHFKSLLKQYNIQATFAMVVMSSKAYTARQIQQKFEVNIPVYFDTSIAKSCGVYSTPQAVIIDSRQQLYYRGNYNRSRYCTDKKSNYAQQALDNLLHDNYPLIFSQFALTAYGCELPNAQNNRNNNQNND